MSFLRGRADGGSARVTLRETPPYMREGTSTPIRSSALANWLRT